MRQDKTLKICMNHYVQETANIKPNVGSEKSWVYNTVDFDDKEKKNIPSMFAIRFKNPEIKEAFKAAFESAQKANIANTANSVIRCDCLYCFCAIARTQDNSQIVLIKNLERIGEYGSAVVTVIVYSVCATAYCHLDNIPFSRSFSEATALSSYACLNLA